MLAKRFSLPPMVEPPYEFSKVQKCKRNLEGSVIVRCPDRNAWLSQLSELILLCNEAADRAYKKGMTKDAPHSGGKPLSLEYVADRLDIDDPLRGYVVRTADRGWMQGFITITTFTTFHAWFHWDSLAKQAGLGLEEDDRFVATLDVFKKKLHSEQINTQTLPLPLKPARGSSKASRKLHKLSTYRVLFSHEKGDALVGSVIWAPPSGNISGWEPYKGIGPKPDNCNEYTVSIISSSCRKLKPRAIEDWHERDISPCYVYELVNNVSEDDSIEPRNIETSSIDCTNSIESIEDTSDEGPIFSNETSELKISETTVESNHAKKIIEEPQPAKRKSRRAASAAAARALKPLKQETTVKAPISRRKRGNTHLTPCEGWTVRPRSNNGHYTYTDTTTGNEYPSQSAARSHGFHFVESSTTREVTSSSKGISATPYKTKSNNGEAKTGRKLSARAIAEAEAQAAVDAEIQHMKKWSLLRKVDGDGSLSRLLEAQLRDGDPDKEGVVWPNIAEISLLGALGCGRTLIKLILDELSGPESPYEYAVMQATEASVPFYESMGFCRVGAIVRHSEKDDVEQNEEGTATDPKTPNKNENGEKILYKDDLSDFDEGVNEVDGEMNSEEDEDWRSSKNKKKRKSKPKKKTKNETTIKLRIRSATKKEDTSTFNSGRPARDAAKRAVEAIQLSVEAISSTTDEMDVSDDVVNKDNGLLTVETPIEKVVESDTPKKGNVKTPFRQDGIGNFIAKSDDTPRSIALMLTAKYAADYKKSVHRLKELEAQLVNSASLNTREISVDENKVNISTRKNDKKKRRHSTDIINRIGVNSKISDDGSDSLTDSCESESSAMSDSKIELEALRSIVNAPLISVKWQQILFLNKNILGLAAGSKLHEGTILRVPEPRKIRSGRFAWQKPTRTIEANDNDTPIVIAAANGVSVKALLQANSHIQGLKAKSQLIEGTILKLPNYLLNGTVCDTKERPDSISLESLEGISDVIAYRHWTFRNESYENSAESYMMAMKLQKRPRGVPPSDDSISIKYASKFVNLEDAPVSLPPAIPIMLDYNYNKNSTCETGQSFQMNMNKMEVDENDASVDDSRPKKRRRTSLNYDTNVFDRSGVEMKNSNKTNGNTINGDMGKVHPDAPLPLRVRLKSNNFKTGLAPMVALYRKGSSLPRYLMHLRPTWPKVKVVEPDRTEEELEEAQHLADEELLSSLKPPKRALSAYTFFMKVNRVKVIELNPGIKQTMVMTKVSELWKLTTEEGKKEYIAMAEEDKKRSVKERMEYDSIRAGPLRREAERERRLKKAEKEAKKPPPKLFSKVVQVRPHPAALLGRHDLQGLSLTAQCKALGFAPYYFVLTYIPDLRWARLAPMVIRGRFESEERGMKDLVGRTRWMLEPEGSSMEELDIPASRCVIVRSRAVRRCPDADKEEWHIIDYSDDDIDNNQTLDTTKNVVGVDSTISVVEDLCQEKNKMVSNAMIVSSEIDCKPVIKRLGSNCIDTPEPLIEKTLLNIP